MKDCERLIELIPEYPLCKHVLRYIDKRNNYIKQLEETVNEDQNFVKTMTALREVVNSGNEQAMLNAVKLLTKDWQLFKDVHLGPDIGRHKLE